MNRFRHLPVNNEGRHAALARLASVAPLDAAAERAVIDAALRPRIVPTRLDLMREGRPIAEPLLILHGWAARTRLLEDGRRQIISVLLPGDVVGLAGQRQALAAVTVTALTALEVCPAPPVDASPALANLYATCQALDEAYLLAQITRLGRMNAEERLADLLLEWYERLASCGLVARGGYALPLTQEMLADVTGLTSVHVNRMLQQLRRQNDITLTAGYLTITDPATLGRRVGRLPVNISAR